MPFSSRLILVELVVTTRGFESVTVGKVEVDAVVEVEVTLFFRIDLPGMLSVEPRRAPGASEFIILY